MRTVLIATLLLLACLPAGATASEVGFLQSLSGDWSGTGKVLTRIGGTNLNVSCTLRSDASASTVSMNGKCRGLAVFTRSFSATVKAAGERYTGNYVGPSGLPSKLAGSRKGTALNLRVTWARLVNGDRDAVLMIEKVGQDRLRLQTVDQDPASGQSVVTSRIDLQRPSTAER
ncbi:MULTISPECIES: hypothetical protein [Rhizobium]|uniref:hypothetical protein n=1 Tax=Rhizobium phaseoli TaxID=396 RepID=UPI0002FD4F8F|nr:hypothetical protein [Rhizobium phaseoli]ANL37541.1 hypothetical protein AMC89_PD00082 [Rhizobium phaseoli]ANM01252.1 hypothetical protein AMC79_PD00082 [Rhizobium phaseoli]KKZ83362.1 hypothetical protein RPHASCH2410_PD00350 [Rhizobium phaseoli Ch24-10]RDJ04462.1 hypothetical protein B5K04_25155 [Rhizobium phaseoli]RDJ06349.1 hypothetical protein B5K05_25225 [Rhizobium phaseoli]